MVDLTDAELDALEEGEMLLLTLGTVRMTRVPAEQLTRLIVEVRRWRELAASQCAKAPVGAPGAADAPKEGGDE